MALGSIWLPMPDHRSGVECTDRTRAALRRPEWRARREGLTLETRVVYSPGGLLLEQTRPPSSRRWLLDGDRMTIGRDALSGIHVDDASLSRHHADLVRNGRSWSVMDARSTNGTFVNGRRVSEVDRPGKSGGRYVCELSLILPDSSAL
jgi:pSer/pThr/pTyr-binding forkhead associated (FHA) protein